MEALKETVVCALQSVFAPRAIVERNDMDVRKVEHLQEIQSMAQGPQTETVPFKENGLLFEANVWLGQKTGFFFDQKKLRSRIEGLAKGRSVLDVFAYSGAAGLYALRGGASQVTFMDSSQTALTNCQRHVTLNFPKQTEAARYLCQDAFEFFTPGQPQSFGMVIVDPPALIKTQKDKEAGQKAYHFLNRSAMRMVKTGGIFVTSSCSHFLSADDFVWLLRRASVQSGVRLDLLEEVGQSPDHPLSIYFPESRYLKSFIFKVG